MVGLDETKARRESNQHVAKVQRVSEGLVAFYGCNGNLKGFLFIYLFVINLP